MIFLKNNLKIFIIILLLNSCASLPGLVESPSKGKPNSKIVSSDYTINDVEINVIKINSLTNEQINNFNNIKIDELDFLNKRAVFVYMREISGLTPKQLSVAMSNIRKYYRDITHNNTEFFLFKAEYI